MLIPQSFNGGAQKFTQGYTSLPKQALAYCAPATRPSATAAGSRTTAIGTGGIAKRRKVTDVSFLKSGGARTGTRTQGGPRSASKNRTAGMGLQMAATMS